MQIRSPDVTWTALNTELVLWVQNSCLPLVVFLLLCFCVKQATSRLMAISLVEADIGIIDLCLPSSSKFVTHTFPSLRTWRSRVSFRLSSLLSKFGHKATDTSTSKTLVAARERADELGHTNRRSQATPRPDAAKETFYFGNTDSDSDEKAGSEENAGPVSQALWLPEGCHVSDDHSRWSA